MKLFSSPAAILLLLAAIFVLSCVGQQPEADVAAATSALAGDQLDESSGSPVQCGDKEDDEEYHNVKPSFHDAVLPTRRPMPSLSNKPRRPSPSRKPTWPSPSRKPHKPTPSRQPARSHTPSPSPSRLTFKKLI